MLSCRHGYPTANNLSCQHTRGVAPGSELCTPDLKAAKWQQTRHTVRGFTVSLSCVLTLCLTASFEKQEEALNENHTHEKGIQDRVPAIAVSPPRHYLASAGAPASSRHMR